MSKVDAIDAALDALSPFYEEGDDGDAIRMALAALASECGFADSDEFISSLAEDLGHDVNKLSELAKGGEYGAGLTASGAKEINGIVQDVVESLREHVQNVRRKSKRRPPTPKRDR
ncbi:MAG: hypothetical protein Q8L14_30680 [Myxococcales bacterium]|nr:hypothetical protein [Myxococcales bacterium]